MKSPVVGPAAGPAGYLIVTFWLQPILRLLAVVDFAHNAFVPGSAFRAVREDAAEQLSSQRVSAEDALHLCHDRTGEIAHSEI